MIQEPKKRALVGNAADESQVKNAENRILNGRMRELEDIRFLIATPQGRRFLSRILGLCGLYELSYTGSSETFFREGSRNIALKLLSEINESDSEGYLKILNEAKNG